MDIICINCGWVNTEDSDKCEKCKQPLKHTKPENINESSSKTVISDFQTIESIQEIDVIQTIDNRYELVGIKCQMRDCIIWDAKDIITEESISLVLLSDSTKRKYFLEEYKYLSQLHLPGVLYPRSFGECESKIYYTVDWVNDKLSSYCGEIDVNIAEMVFGRIAILLNSLHSKNIILGNLSTETILVGKDRIPVIAPSAFLSIRHDSITYAGGTFSFNQPYLAPEFYTASGAKQFPTQKGDVWALGAIMYELITKEKPFDENCNLNHQKEVKYNPYFHFYSTTEMDIVRLRRLQYLVSRCLESNPDDRPSPRFISECMSLRVVKSQKQCNLYAIVHPLVGVVYTIEADMITPFTAQCVPGPGPLPPMQSYFMGVRYENGDECGYLKLEDNGQIVKFAITSKEEYNRRCRYS